MSLKEKISSDMKDALRAKDSEKLSTLRLAISELKKREIDGRKALDEAETQKVLSTMIKQRKESISAFESAGRTELADKEKAEVAILEAYLPAQMSRQEVEAIVAEAIRETGASTSADLGKVMKAVLPKIAGRADGKLVNEVVKLKLT